MRRADNLWGLWGLQSRCGDRVIQSGLLKEVHDKYLSKGIGRTTGMGSPIAGEALLHHSCCDHITADDATVRDCPQQWDAAHLTFREHSAGVDQRRWGDRVLQLAFSHFRDLALQSTAGGNEYFWNFTLEDSRRSSTGATGDSASQAVTESHAVPRCRSLGSSSNLSAGGNRVNVEMNLEWAFDTVPGNLAC
jgi:hypothetical protein